MLLLFKKYKRHVKKVQFPCFIVQENICTLFEKKYIVFNCTFFEKNMELDVKTLPQRLGSFTKSSSRVF